MSNIDKQRITAVQVLEMRTIELSTAIQRFQRVSPHASGQAVALPGIQ